MTTDSSMTPAAENITSQENHRDENVRPQDDLYRHANGAWLNTAQIPADQGTYGSFMALRDDSEEAVRAIIESAQEEVREAGGEADARKLRIANIYTSFMDEERIEASGVEPIRNDITSIYATTNINDLIKLAGSFYRRGVSGFLQAGASSDAGAPERNLLTFIQGGLGLPDESYYREEQFAELRTEYVEHLSRLLTLGGIEAADAAAESVMELETVLASHHWDRVKCRDAQARYNLMTNVQLLELIPSLAHWFEGADIAEKYYSEVDVWQPSYLTGLEEALQGTEVATWQHWLAVQLIRSNAPYLSSAFVNENFDFYSAKLSGVQELRDRWKRGVAFTEGAVGEDIGQLYVAEHFPQRSKDKMEALVANLTDAYRISIGDLEWMSPATKEKALEKLSMFRSKIGYPNEWIDYSPINTVPDNVISNIAASNEFDFLRELKKIDDGVDRELWFMYPQTVNAYYHPLLNEIAFPAAILRFPFFDADRDAAANYGAIGAVIGHEIGHGFDDQGSQFDGTGELKNWWTDEDRAAFETLTGKLVDQYDALVPPEAPEHHVNGKLTLGENIGDLGGLGIAYTAYKLDLAAKGIELDEVIDGLTGDQRFFYSWAECWRTLMRPETMINRITTDPHSPGEFRCNQVPKNMDAFHEAFGTKPGDGMWMAPEDRVKIW